MSFRSCKSHLLASLILGLCLVGLGYSESSVAEIGFCKVALTRTLSFLSPPADEELFDLLLQTGAPEELALRISQEYPVLARRILRRFPGNTEWVNVYRGMKVSISDYDPLYFSVSNALTFNSFMGDWVAIDIGTAKTMAGANGIVLKMSVPREFWELYRGRSASYMQIPRNWFVNWLPRRDVFTTEFVETTQEIWHARSENLILDWQQYPYDEK